LLQLKTKNMKKIKMMVSCLLTAGMLLMAGCKSMNKTQKGAVIGTAGGGAIGAVVGRTLGNTALGTIVGAAVGGAAGAVIGKQMDKQAEEMKRNVPNAKVERVGEGIVVEFTDRILFDFDRYDLTAQARANLDKAIDVLKKYEDTNIEVQGHTDNKGTHKYNEKLSVRRANTVSDYLAAKGIRVSRLYTNGFGERTPKYTNETEEGRSQNRRVDFLITANEKMKADAKYEAEKGTGTN